MRLDIGVRRGIGLGVFDLLVDRVGVDHDPHRAAQVVLAQPADAAQIDQPVGFGEEPPHPLARQPVIDVVDRVPIGPAVAETVALHDLAQVVEVVRAIDRDAGDPRVVGIGAVVLDVPRLPAELFERG